MTNYSRFAASIFIACWAFTTNYAQNMGVKIPVNTLPNTTLDINGAVAFREGTALTLVNGANNDISLATEYSFYRLMGPTTVFSITGFTGGVDGRIITVVNATSYTMTISGATGSTAANQLLTGGSTFSVSANGSATFMYNTTLTKWVLTGTSGSSLSSWSLTGNSGTIAGTNFVGTTDAQDLVFKTNNTERVRLNTNGNVGIGQTVPTQKLEVRDGNLLLSNSSTAGELRCAEPSASGTNYTALKAQAQAANITYTLPAADGTSGQVLSTNGSGTMSWLTYSGAGAVKVARKTANESVTSSTTMQNDDHLVLALGANETWEIYIQIEARGNSNNYKMQFTAPTGATLNVISYQIESNNINDFMTAYSTPTTGSYQMQTATSTGIFVRGIVTTSATAGNLQLQWAQVNTDVVATQLRTGSYIKATKLL